MRFAWKVFLGAILVIGVSTLLVEGLVEDKFGALRLGQLDEQIMAEVDSLARISEDAFRSGDVERLRALADELAERRSDRRITMLGPDGAVLADSLGEPEEMENHGDRPEVQEPGTIHQRMSESVGLNLRYVAEAVYSTDGELLGFARSSLLTDPLSRELSALRTAIRTGALLALLVGLALSVILARRVTGPIGAVNRMLSALGRGEFGEPLVVEGNDEIGKLTASANSMADQLRSRQQLIATEVAEKEVILSSMEEGLLAVDEKERIVLANIAARQLLSESSQDLVGHRLSEITRMPEVLAAASLALGRDQRVETEFTLQLPNREERIIGLWTSPSSELAGDKRIAVMVLRDLTEIRRLEKVRTDFVANVSHELKTPLTSMRGYVEAVIEDTEMPEPQRERFLKKAFENTQRLTDIVSDLLSLARLEAEVRPAQHERIELGTLVAECVRRAASDAETRGIHVRLHPASDSLNVVGDRTALGTAVDNLLSNAVKYSPQNAPVMVAVYADGASNFVEVSDEGPGIARDQQERIFERFYRVDKDRSRALGGTGLGLSIVRNVMLTHGGDVAVESELGMGSVFRIRLPAA